MFLSNVVLSGDDYLKAMWPQITSQRSRRSIRSCLLSAGPVHRWRHGAYAVAWFPDSSICTEDSRYGNVRWVFIFCDRSSNLRRTLLPRRKAPLIGLTIHGSTGVPVLTPPRVPRLEGEDTACIILAHEGTDDSVAGSGEEMGLNGE